MGGARLVTLGRTPPLPLSQSSGPISGSTQGSSQRVHGFPLTLPSDVTKVDILIGNTTGDGGADDLTGINIAIGPHNGSGGYVGGSSAADAVYLSQAVPGNGFLTIPDVPVTLGTDRQVLLSHSIPAGVTVAYVGNVYGFIANGTETVDPLPSMIGPISTTWFWAALRYRTSKRKVIVLGDYNIMGAPAAAWNPQTWPRLLEGANDWGMDTQCSSGFHLSRMADPGTYPLMLSTVQWAGADVILAVGIGDLTSGNSLTQVQGWYADVIAQAVAGGVGRIFGNTYAPAAAADNSLRAAFNADLVANWASYGLHQAPTDLDALLRNPSDHSQLDPAYDSGDGSNWNSAAHSAAAAAWTTDLG